MKKIKPKLKKKIAKVQCRVCIAHNLNCSQCREYFKLRYPQAYIEILHSRGLGNSPDAPTASIPTPLPDVGKLRGLPRQHRTTLYSASPDTDFYRGKPSIKLEGIRADQVLVWAEQWRDAYEDLNANGMKGFYLTVRALHGLVIHSELPQEDHADAHLLIQALYPDDHFAEGQDWKNEFTRADARKVREIEEAKKKSEEKKYVAPVGNQWGIPVEAAGGKYRIFGFHVTSVIRWMGADAWTESDTRLALNRLGLKEVSNNTIKAQLRSGRDGSRGECAKLSLDQDEKLNSVIHTPKKIEPKKKEKKIKNAWSSKSSRGKGIGGKEVRPPANKPKKKKSINKKGK